MPELRPAPPPGRAASPWQFGLRTLLLLMASISVLLLVLGIIGLAWSVVVIWFLLLVAAHVAGNSWLSHERARRGGQSAEARPVDPASAPRPPAPLAADPEQVRLRQPAVFHWLDYAVVAAAAVLGGGLGGAALWGMYASRSGKSAIVVGAISAAVIGGFVGFLCVTFARVAFWAVNGARQMAQPDRHVQVLGAPPLPPEALRPRGPSADTGQLS
ncbi:MAG: hypothetical protein JNG90_02275 [Planctomycetaceae bacterium]|nr:hypothetical protein [Planctomycetaceae bacterium]